MPVLMKARLNHGVVLVCDQRCHDSPDRKRKCICFGRFNGIGYDAARRILADNIGEILADLHVRLPNMRSLEIVNHTNQSHLCSGPSHAQYRQMLKPVTHLDT